MGSAAPDPGARAVRGAALPGPSRPRAPASRGRASVSSAVPSALLSARRGARCLSCALVTSGVVFEAARLLRAGWRGRGGRGRATAPAVLVHSGPRPSSGSQDTCEDQRARQTGVCPEGSSRWATAEQTTRKDGLWVLDSDGEGGRGRRRGRGSFWCRSSAEATRGDQHHRREQRRDLDSEPGESWVSLLSNDLQNKTSFWQK